jgi:hypothetical protein
MGAFATLGTNDIQHNVSAVMLSIIMLSVAMEQHAIKDVNNCLNTNIYSYLETSGGQSYNP